MTNIKTEASLAVLLIVSFLIFAMLAHLQGLELSHLQTYVHLLPEVTFVDAILVTIFSKWGWRLKIFRGWLVPFPDLSGTWLGTIQSNWESSPGQRLKPIPAMLTISQSFLHLSCIVRTAEMQSRSYAEGLVVDSDRQLLQLAYMYSSKPKISLASRSAPHDGAAVFDIVRDQEPNHLKGRYWTERQTTGEMRFEFSSKAILSDLPDDLEAHPMSQPGSGQREKA
jgi:predicted pore-forming effector associated with SMODS systems